MSSTDSSTLTLLDAALAYAARGWRVFPLHTPTDSGCSCGKDCGKDCGKHPRVKDWPHVATTEPEQIRRWWTRWRGANIAILTGDGLVVVDVDPRNGGHLTIEDIEAEYGKFPETVESVTGSGGRHLFYQHPGAKCQRWPATLGPGVDIKADGGYIVAPPALHATGQRYEWEVSSHPDMLPLSPLPTWFPLIDPGDDGAYGAADHTPNGRPEDIAPEGSPGSDFNRRASADVVRTMLLRHGWRVVEQRNGVDYLRRPGKQGRALSATLGFVAPNVFYVFSTTAAPFHAQAAYQPFSIYGLLEHGGDFKAAARTLAADGYGAQRNGPPSNTPPPPDIALGSERPTPLSDQYNAEALVQAHGADLRYCREWKEWLRWTGHRWERHAEGEVMRRAKRTVKGLGKALAEMADADAKAMLAHIKSSLSAARLEAMIRLAQSELGIELAAVDLDRDPWLLNCLNGTIDLRTGERRPHRRNDLITKLCPVDYDPEATCLRWEQCLREIFLDDGELITFIQRAIGYSLTGDVRERALFICYGVGRNGKSTFMEVIAELLDDYAMRTPTRTLMEKRNADYIPNDVAALKDMRFVHASESGEGKRLDEEFIKDATGRDTITARFMHGEWFGFRPVFKLWLRTNHKPIIRGTDPAIWDRPRLIPFLARFTDATEDKTLPAQLRRELPGILRWAVTGCLSWQINGLVTPKAVQQATDDYRQEMDVIGDFLADCCTSLPGASVTSKALMAAYAHWCEVNGEQPLNSKALGARLRERGYLPEKGTHGLRLWRGIGLTASDDKK